MKTEKEIDLTEMIAEVAIIVGPMEKEVIEEDTEVRVEIEEDTEAETEVVTEEIEEVATVDAIERVALAAEVAATVIEEDTAPKEAPAQLADDHDFVTIDIISLSNQHIECDHVRMIPSLITASIEVSPK